MSCRLVIANPPLAKRPAVPDLIERSQIARFRNANYLIHSVVSLPGIVIAGLIYWYIITMLFLKPWHTSYEHLSGSYSPTYMYSSRCCSWDSLTEASFCVRRPSAVPKPGFSLSDLYWPWYSVLPNWSWCNSWFNLTRIICAPEQQLWKSWVNI